LALVADQHDLGLGVGGVVEQPGEAAGVDHPGLVDDQHGAVGELPVAAALQVAQEAVDGVAVDPCPGLQLVGGSAGKRGSDHAIPVALPQLARRVDRCGLAGAGLRSDHLDAIARGDELAHHRLLLIGQHQPAGPPLEPLPLPETDDSGTLTDPFGGLVDHPHLDLQHLGRRQQRLTAAVKRGGRADRCAGRAAVQRDDLIRGDEAICDRLDLLDGSAA
jgi:hypothetical protein